MKVRTLQNEPIMNWIYAGPFDQDVSALYFDNYIVPVEPYQHMIEQAREKISNAARAVEGDEISLYGETLPFRFLRVTDADKKATWARFGTYPHYLATYAVCDIEVDAAQTVTFDLWATGTVFVQIGGKEVFGYREVGRVSNSFSFEAYLEKGITRCVVLLINVHLHSTNSFALSLRGVDCTVSAPLLQTVGDRVRVEADIGRMYLRKPLLFPKDEPTLCCDTPLYELGQYLWSIESVGRKTLAHPFRPQCGNLVRKDASAGLEMDGLAADKLSAGSYRLSIDYRDTSGRVIKGIAFQLAAVSFIEGLPDADYAGRKVFLMRHMAKMPNDTMREMNVVYRELAKLPSGLYDQFDEEAVRQTLRYINDRYDCADFAMHGVLRLYIRYRNTALISEGLKQEIKDCILGFKYWVDEAGKSMMFTRSENHEMLFFSAEYVAGLLFPAETFSNSGQNGLFHALKGRLAAERWIKEKGRWGYTEWHSNTYYEEDILALLSIIDFGEENAYIRRLAKSLLDFTSLLMASQNFGGVLATTHGRCYENTLMNPATEPISRLMWLMYGMPKKLLDAPSIGSVALADSGYAPPRQLEAIAVSQENLRTRSRMGMFAQKGLGGVNCETLRTKDYILSGLVESCAGEHGAQVSAGQALLKGNVPVFVTSFDNKSETTRPSYWGGQYRIPKTIMYGNMLAYIYKIDTQVGYTHCYFPIESFDETHRVGDFIFGRSAEAYIGVYSQNPYMLVEEGEYRRRELLCLEKENIWIFQMGSKEENGSFEAFMDVVLKNPVARDGEALAYTMPCGAQLRLGWDTTCTVNGEPILNDDFPLFDNPYAFGVYGEGLLHTRYNKGVLNFNM